MSSIFKDIFYFDVSVQDTNMKCQFCMRLLLPQKDKMNQVFSRDVSHTAVHLEGFCVSAASKDRSACCFSVDVSFVLVR